MQAATESAPCPPYSSGTCTAEKPGGVERLERLLRETRILVDISRVRRDLLLRQVPDRRTQFLVLPGEAEEQLRLGHAGDHLPDVLMQLAAFDLPTEVISGDDGVAKDADIFDLDLNDVTRG